MFDDKIPKQYIAFLLSQCHLGYICANLIENESLVTSTDKKIQSDNGHICKILKNNPPVQLNYRLNSSIWKIKIIAKIINEIIFFITVNNSCHAHVPDRLFLMPAFLKLSMHLAN